MPALTFKIFYFQISGFLTVDKAKRLTAKEALNHPFFQREVSLWVELHCTLIISSLRIKLGAAVM